MWTLVDDLLFTCVYWVACSWIVGSVPVSGLASICAFGVLGFVALGLGFGVFLLGVSGGFACVLVISGFLGFCFSFCGYGWTCPVTVAVGLVRYGFWCFGFRIWLFVFEVGGVYFGFVCAGFGSLHFGFLLDFGVWLGLCFWCVCFLFWFWFGLVDLLSWCFGCYW